MVQLHGEKDFSHSAADVWTKLSDARFLARCVPGVEAVPLAETERAICTLRPGFAFVRGTLELTVRVVDPVPNQAIQLLLHSKGIGTTSDVDVNLALSPQGDGTRVHWTVAIKNLGGLLKAVPSGLVQAAAQKVVADALTQVEAELAK